MRSSFTFIVSAILLIILGYYPKCMYASNEAEIEFEKKYQEWGIYISQWKADDVIIVSTGKLLFDCPQFQEIVKLGIPILPLLVDKMKKDIDGRFLWRAIEDITKVKIRAEYDKEKNIIVFPDYPNVSPQEEVYLYWWHEGRKETPQRFEKLYGEWTNLKKQSQVEEAQEKYQRIIDMGIIVLPYLIEKIQSGDTDLIPAVSTLTDEEVKEDAKSEECVKWWEENKQKWYIPIEDKPIEKEPEEKKEK